MSDENARPDADPAAAADAPPPSAPPPSDASAAEPDAAAEGAPLPAGEEASLSPTEQLRADIARLQDQVLRGAADFQNFRRRAMLDIERASERGRADAVTQLLDVVDDLSRTVEAADAAQPSAAAFTSLKEGVDLVYQKLLDGLGRLDVEPIAAQGQPFDVNLHEALMQQDAPEGTEPETVMSVIQTGYTMGERVLRHALVSVSK